MSHTTDTTIWEVNGLQLVLDLEDADTAERYEHAFAKMDGAEKKLPKDGKLSEQIRAYCAMFKELYDDIFGTGTGDKILGDKANTRVCNEVYDQFLAFVTKQRTASMEQSRDIVTKYSPNRAQRRTAKHGKKKG